MMPVSFDVELEADLKPVFPPFCVGCSEPNPDATLHDTSASQGWFQRIFIDSGDLDPRKVEVPICSSCKERHQATRLRRQILKVLVWSGSLVGAVWISVRSGTEYRKLMGIGVFIGLLTPFSVWEFLNPLVFKIEADDDDVTYEFRNEQYAEAFASANDSEVD